MKLNILSINCYHAQQQPHNQYKNLLSHRNICRLFVLNYAPNSMWTYFLSVYFINNKKSHLLMERPDFAITAKTRLSRNKKKLVGLPATEAVIKHGLELISMYIEDY